MEFLAWSMVGVLVLLGWVWAFRAWFAEQWCLSSRPIDVYLACPYSSGLGRELSGAGRARAMGWRREHALQATRWLWERHRVVFNPLALPESLGAALGDTWETWERYDLTALGLCRELWVLELPGWRESTGVQAELAAARAQGLRIRHCSFDKRGRFRPGAYERKTVMAKSAGRLLDILIVGPYGADPVVTEDGCRGRQSDAAAVAAGKLLRRDLLAVPLPCFQHALWAGYSSRVREEVDQRAHIARWVAACREVWVLQLPGAEDDPVVEEALIQAAYQDKAVLWMTDSLVDGTVQTRRAV